MPDEHQDIDLSDMTKEQVLTGVGDLLLGMLGTNQVALCAMSSTGAITFLNPLLVQHIPPGALARALLEPWSEEEVERFLAHVYD
jgi:hypothetical protein